MEEESKICKRLLKLKLKVKHKSLERLTLSLHACSTFTLYTFKYKSILKSKVGYVFEQDRVLMVIETITFDIYILL